METIVAYLGKGLAGVGWVVNVVKDSFIWQADLVQAHPRLSLLAIWSLAIAVLA